MHGATNQLDMGNPTGLIDHAAAMNDRWAFFAALVVIGVIGYACLRYLANQLAVARADTLEQAKEVAAGRERLIVALVRANELHEEIKDLLQSNRK